MAKDPAFLFYPGDWLGGTMGMTLEEKGAYLELLIMQWNCGRIANASAKKLVGEELWHRLAHKFSADGSGFFNHRLEHEKEKRKKHSEKQSLNAKKRWHSGNAVALPLESEDVSEIENHKKTLPKNKDSTDRKTEFLTNQKWKEEFCMAKSLQPTDLEKLQKEFISDCDLRGEYVDSYKRYFTNWFNKNKNGSTTNQRVTTGSNGKQGTSAARIQTAKNW